MNENMTSRDELLTVDEVIAELRIARSTWDEWRKLRRGPAAFALPNRSLRIRRSVLDAWLESRGMAGCQDPADRFHHLW
jgi:predicted DNA-binding transcriptional regulator AlpA